MADRRRLDEQTLKAVIEEAELDPYAQQRVLEANIEPEPEQSRGHGAARGARIRAGGL